VIGKINEAAVIGKIAGFEATVIGKLPPRDPDNAATSLSK
jgi:hypothetical protein